jgi:hypothetical protein
VTKKHILPAINLIRIIEENKQLIKISSILTNEKKRKSFEEKNDHFVRPNHQNLPSEPR